MQSPKLQDTFFFSLGGAHLLFLSCEKIAAPDGYRTHKPSDLDANALTTRLSASPLL